MTRPLPFGWGGSTTGAGAVCLGWFASIAALEQHVPDGWASRSVAISGLETAGLRVEAPNSATSATATQRSSIRAVRGCRSRRYVGSRNAGGGVGSMYDAVSWQRGRGDVASHRDNE